jgi:hypothetical protein
MQRALGTSKQPYPIRLVAFYAIITGLATMTVVSILYFMSDAELFWHYHNHSYKYVALAISVIFTVAAIMRRDMSRDLAIIWICTNTVASAPLLVNAMLPPRKALPDYLYSDEYYDLRGFVAACIFMFLVLLLAIAYFKRSTVAPAAMGSGSGQHQQGSPHRAAIAPETTPTPIPSIIQLDEFWQPRIEDIPCPPCLPNYYNSGDQSKPDC